MSMGHGYVIKYAQFTGDATSVQVLVANTTGRIISLAALFISCGATAGNVKLQDTAGTPVVAIGPFFLGVTGNTGLITMSPGAIQIASGLGLNVLATTATSTTTMVWYYLL